jgi:DNA-binding IclR family transcriptional regulator
LNGEQVSFAGWPAFRAELERVRRQGHAVDDEEDEVGFRCVAAPIMDDRGAVAAAVSVVGTTEEITAPRLPSLVEKVKATAAAISEVLHGNPPE